jgi:hypothetical protein
MQNVLELFAVEIDSLEKRIEKLQKENEELKLKLFMLENEKK